VDLRARRAGNAQVGAEKHPATEDDFDPPVPFGAVGLWGLVAPVGSVPAGALATGKKRTAAGGM